MEKERINEGESSGPTTVSKGLLKKLIEELIVTKNPEAANTIAIKIIELAQLDSLEVDIEPITKAIVKEVDIDHVSTLIWFCCNFDCSEFIELFTSVFVEHDNNTHLEVINVIDIMQGPIPIGVKQSVINKLLQHNNQLDEGYFKKHYVSEVIAMIEKLPVC